MINLQIPSNPKPIEGVVMMNTKHSSGGYVDPELILDDSVKLPLPGETVIQNVKHSHYKKDVRHLDMIDVYRVIELWGPMHPAQEHALKKVLAAGQRLHKGTDKDIQDAIDSLVRWQEMRREDAKKIVD